MAVIIALGSIIIRTVSNDVHIGVLNEFAVISEYSFNRTLIVFVALSVYTGRIVVKIKH